MSPSWLNPPCRVCFTGICALHSPDGMSMNRDRIYRADFTALALPHLAVFKRDAACPYDM